MDILVTGVNFIKRCAGAEHKGTLDKTTVGTLKLNVLIFGQSNGVLMVNNLDFEWHLKTKYHACMQFEK